MLINNREVEVITIVIRRRHNENDYSFNDGTLLPCLSRSTNVTAATNFEKATFAGGCFWCMEHPFDEIPGVVSVTSGYTGGRKSPPPMKRSRPAGPGHAESVQIVYDPSRVTYEKLLEVFWHNIDPTVKDRQFCDTGHQYRSAIFYQNEEQHRLALAVARPSWKRASPSKNLS